MLKIKISSRFIKKKQDACSNEHAVCPMPLLHKYDAK